MKDLAKRETVLITRPAQDADDIAGILQAQGYNVLCTPFIAVSFDDFTLSDLSAYAGLIFTSANAVRALQGRAYSPDIPAYCVGTQTMEAAQKAGFTKVYNADGEAGDLTELLSKQSNDKPFLYLRGRDISQDLKALRPLNIDDIIVYHTDKIEEIPTEVASLLQAGQVNHVLFFSTRTAQAFMDWVKATKGVEAGLTHTKALCLGASMVESLSMIDWQDVQVAARPARESLMALLTQKN